MVEVIFILVVGVAMYLSYVAGASKAVELTALACLEAVSDGRWDVFVKARAAVIAESEEV